MQRCTAAKQMGPQASERLRVRGVAQECLALGRPLLIENIEEELDPVLDPVLDHRVIRKGRGLTIQLADKEARSRLPLSSTESATNIQLSEWSGFYEQEEKCKPLKPSKQLLPLFARVSCMGCCPLEQAWVCRWIMLRRSGCTARRGCPTRTSRRSCRRASPSSTSPSPRPGWRTSSWGSSSSRRAPCWHLHSRVKSVNVWVIHTGGSVLLQRCSLPVEVNKRRQTLPAMQSLLISAVW